MIYIVLRTNRQELKINLDYKIINIVRWLRIGMTIIFHSFDV